MKRILAIVVAVVLMEATSWSPVLAGVGVQAGGARDWLKLGDGMDWEEVGALGGGLSYDIVLDEEGYQGLSIGTRFSDDTNIQQYLLEYWTVAAVEWFIGANMDVWDKELVGETKFLGGGRAGLRFDDVAGLPLELSGHYSAGDGGTGHAGIFLGLRITQEIGGE